MISLERALCTDCELHKLSLSNCVGGKGPSDAEIMLVGEALGAEEDVAGVPFIGRAGKILDALLIDSGYDPASLRVTNAVRCRPPGNRDPEAVEIDACRKHLRAEIHAVKPKVIVAMGAVALHALTKKSGIKSWRGKSVPLHEEFDYECEVWPIYHPMAIGYLPVLRRTALADILRIRNRNTEQVRIPFKWLRDIYPDEKTPVVVRNVREAMGKRVYHAYFLDIETIDEQCTIVEGPTQAQLQHVWMAEGGQLQASPPVVALMEGRMRQLLFPLVGLDATLVTHNGWRFDIPKIREHLGIPLPWGRDTLVMGYLDDETQPLGLEPMCVRYGVVERGWKEDRDAPLGSEQLAEYGARDVVNTGLLYGKLCEALGDRVKIADMIILPGYEALLACSERGIYIDGDEVARVKPEIAGHVERTRASLQAFVGPLGETKKGVPIPFNPNSRLQVGNVLARWFTLGRTPEGQLKTDKATIESCLNAAEYEEHPEAIPFLRDFQMYQNYRTTLSTYITPYEKAAASPDRRMHNEYTAYNTVTGRTSARKSNVQNLDRRYKNFLSAPPGAVAVEADYAGIEFRIGGWYANEPTVLGHYREDPNWDPHAFMASLFYGIPEDEIKAEHKAMMAAGNPNTKRQIMKSANFALQYIGVEQTLIEYAAQFGIQLTWIDAKRIVAAWRRTFNGFVGFWNTTWNEALEYGYVQSATGRRRHFGDISLLRGREKEAARREAVNFKIQSLATADIGLLALHECHTVGLPINYFGHDAIRFEFASMAEFVARKDEIRPAMIDRPLKTLREEFGCNITVPLEIEMKVWQK